MTCSKCGYAMEAWDPICPRCKGEGLPKSDQQSTPAKAPTHAAAAVAATSPKSVPRQTSSRYDDDEDEDSWWQLSGGGLLLLALSGYSYWSFTNWEATGGIRRMRWWLSLAYSLGGKWPIIIILALLGFAGLALGIMQFMASQKN